MLKDQELHLTRMKTKGLNVYYFFTETDIQLKDKYIMTVKDVSLKGDFWVEITRFIHNNHELREYVNVGIIK